MKSKSWEWLIPVAILSSGCIEKLVVAIVLVIMAALAALIFAIEIVAWGLVWFPAATLFSLIVAIAIYLLYSLLTQTGSISTVPALIGFFVVFIPSILITLIVKRGSLKPSNPLLQTIARIVGILGAFASGIIVIQIDRLLLELESSWLAHPQLLLTFAPILFGLYLFFRGWKRLI